MARNAAQAVPAAPVTLVESLTDVHPHAQLATEAAASEGKFWPLRDQLLAHQDVLTAKDLIRYAGAARPRHREV